MTKEQQAFRNAYNAGLEAAIFQWSNAQIEEWCEGNPDLVSVFDDGFETYVEMRRGPVQEDWE